MTQDATGRLFLDHQRQKLREIRQAFDWVLDQLDDDDVNWRPNERSNSIANVIVHVAGNVRERFGQMLGGIPYQRDRDAEFSTDLRRSVDELRELNRTVFEQAESILAAMEPARLHETVTFRGQDFTVLALIADNVSHYQQHVGQALYIAKLRLGDAYRVLRPGPRPAAQEG